MKIARSTTRSDTAVYRLLHIFFRNSKYLAFGVAWSTDGSYWSKTEQDEPKFFWYSGSNEDDETKFYTLFIGYLSLAIYYKDEEGPKIKGNFRFNH